jgi:hypothetical protein
MSFCAELENEISNELNCVTLEERLTDYFSPGNKSVIIVILNVSVAKFRFLHV